ncbi:HEPN domain-containing protein [Acinetobacter sp. YZS-X1-1]|uniref:HEPN domain-containing protein n=1 Tax=Acinetobacter sp. YZS-X1-1 TaxID=1501691 RepID=UPI00054CBD7F|nr:HEPN domain-containing protein [Acinetobacter sp. YZS-X1-1]
MFNRECILKLEEEYSFEVNVEDENQSFAGKLTLSPKKCSLRVMTERRPSDNFHKAIIIYCSTLRMNFNLYELKYSGSSANFSLIGPEQNHVSFYEYIFDVGFITCSSTSLKYDEEITGFTIDASIFAKWINLTKKQEELMHKISSNPRDISREDRVEFTSHIEGYGWIILYYHLEQHFSLDEFRIGSKYPPKLLFQFESSKTVSELHLEFNKFYDLMTFFIGSDFKINTLSIDIIENFSSTSSVYFPTDFKIKEITYPLLPLGRNSVRYATHLKELPLDCFNNYYKLPEHKRIIFTKYLRYKRMKSDEEKFLGFFRLLEKLTFKSQSYVDEEILKSILNKSRTYLKKRLDSKMSIIKDLSKRIEKTNQMKYNTLKCLSDFFDSIPIEIQNSLLFKKDELVKITKLRNDITHANEYSIESRDLYQYTNFINALLFLALIAELDIPFDVCIPIAQNLKIM